MFFNSGGSAVGRASVRRAGFLVVAISEGIDVDEHAIFEPQATHELNRTEVVHPHLDRNLDIDLADAVPPAADTKNGPAHDGALALDFRGLAALRGDLGACITLADEV